MKPTDSLRAAADIYEQRNAVYGDNYKDFGAWVSRLFPDGVYLATADDFNRFGVIIQMLSKIGRYAQNFKKGGHDDSLDDLAVYAMMLKELDIEARKQPARGGFVARGKTYIVGEKGPEHPDELVQGL